MAMLASQTSSMRLQCRSPAAFSSSKPCISSRSLSGAFNMDRLSSSRVQLPSGGASRTKLVVTAAAKVTGKIKLELTGGKANPSPPIGPALGSKGVNIMAFCKEYNAQTSKMVGEIIPVEITVYEDRSFTFILKTSPAATLLKKAAGITKGAGKPNLETVGTVTAAQVKEIAQKKLADTNTTRLESAIRMVEGTARSLGLKVVA